MKIISVKKYKQLEKRFFKNNEPDGCSSYDTDEFLALFHEYATSETFWQFLATPYHKLKDYHLFSKIKYAFQRMIKGYSDGDVADMDGWFLRIVPKILGELKKNANSHPELFAAETFAGRHKNDVDFLKDKENLSEAERNIVLNEWLKTIDRMIELFEKAGKYSHFCYCCEEAKRRRQYLDEAFALFSKYFNDLLWW